MTVVSELHQDHVNLSKLLEILEKKVEKLKHDGEPNFSLMADVIGYIANYAEHHHHPREDKMYAFFKGRDAELDKVMADCEVAHQELKGIGGDLLEVIDGILHDAVLPMDEFITRLESFVLNEKAHLDFEEGHIFPKLIAVANDKDWAELAISLPAEADPLFGEKQAEEYKELYKALMQDMNA